MRSQLPELCAVNGFQRMHPSNLSYAGTATSAVTSAERLAQIATEA